MNWLIRILLVWMAACATGPVLAAQSTTQSAAALQAKYAVLTEQLRHTPFQRPLYLESHESANDLNGSIYAVVDYPMTTVSAALSHAKDWCDVMILNINTKFCLTRSGQTNTVLEIGIGKKHSQPVEDAYPIEFSYKAVAATPQYLDIRLDAEKGPLSTRNYRIRLQAIPVENDRTFLHLTYSYGYGLIGRLAMKVYLATAGSGKVGFTVTGKRSDGQPVYVGGMRGVAERSTMRYYLAIDAFLGTLAEQPKARLHKRLLAWYAASEAYPRQLHEMDRVDYIDMKQFEYLRQQSLQ